MVYVALAEVAALIVVAAALLALTRLLRSERREAARERNLILNQLLHATGHTWEAPPSDSQPEPEPEPRESRYTARPGQFFDESV